MWFPPYDADDDLITQAEAQRRSAVRVACPATPLVVLGRGSKAEAEVDLVACRTDGVSVLRRRGGGCAVVLDPGNVVVSLALPVQGIGDNRHDIRALTAWLIAGLATLGIRDVTLAGTADLALAGRKVGGTCVYRNRALLYYCATLLVTPDIALITRYLRHPPREPDYRDRRDHAAFVSCLGLGAWQTTQRLARALDRALAPALHDAAARVAAASI